MHTPGPWRIREWEDGDGHARISIDGDIDATLTFRGLANVPYDNGDESLMANARLIAAAPDMLAALKAQHEAIDVLLAMVIGLDKTFLPTKSSVWPKLLQGKAAIDQATSNH